MAQVAERTGRSRRARRRGRASLIAMLLVAASCVGLAGYFVAHVLWWQRWPEPVALDAPALPIIVAGVTFNVPPAAIRIPMQRRAGVQERIDAAFLWPSLTPPDPAAKPVPGEPPPGIDRVFVTIAKAEGTMTPFERAKTIYPRYAAREPVAGPDGLAVLAFRDGTPYQGEDFVYDPQQPERFFARCSRSAGAAPGTCTTERRIGAADITVRFARDWLAEWRALGAGIERLIARLRPAGG